jgi:hypothetical protein
MTSHTLSCSKQRHTLNTLNGSWFGINRRMLISAFALMLCEVTDVVPQKCVIFYEDAFFCN